jgi:hypothetical protein
MFPVFGTGSILHFVRDNISESDNVILVSAN